MNSSKSNFLQRFNGKIGFITKHGELSEHETISSHYNKKYSTQNSTSSNVKPTLKQLPSSKLSQRGQNLTQSQTMQRSQIGSFYTKDSSSFPSGQQNAMLNRNRRSDAKQKLVNVGANLLQTNLTKKKLGAIKSNSLSWDIKDKDTQDFYHELTNLQMSKAASFCQNPKVHI